MSQPTKSSGTLALVLLTAWALSGSTSGRKGEEVTALDAARCRDRILTYGEARPYALIVFCDDALGRSLGLSYFGAMPTPRIGGWELADRFWQERDWALDATAFVWSRDGSHLYVSTSGVYGSGAIFSLDPLRRTYKRLHPTSTVPDGAVYTIEELDHERRMLIARREVDGGEQRIQVPVD